MEITAHTLPRSRLAIEPRIGHALLIAIGVLSVLFALLGQRPGLPGLPATPLVGGVQSWLADRWGAGDAQSTPSWVVIVSLLAILGAAIALPTPVRAEASQVVEGVGNAWRHAAIGAAILCIPCLLAVAIWRQEPFTANQVFVNSSSSWAALLWIAGMVGCLVYLAPPIAALGVAWWNEQGRRWPWLLIEALALLAILNLAAGLRLWHLAGLPEGIWFDEVDFAHAAERLPELPFQPFGPGNVGHNPSLFFYIMALVFHFGGVGIATERLSSVLFGLLAVVAVYMLGRRVGGAPLGLIAAALLAMGQWAIDFSRFGMSNIAAPGTISLGFAAFGVAMWRPRGFWFALAGLILGLSLLTYAGGFLAGAGVALLVLVVRALIDTPFRRAAWPGMLLLPAGLLVGAAPFLTALWLDASYTLDREQTVSLFNQFGGTGACVRELPNYLRANVLHANVTGSTACLDALWSNTQKHLLMLTVVGDNNGRHNLPGAPMLDAVTGACLLLGLGVCLRRITHWFYLLLLLWLVASLLGGILSLDFEAPQGARTVGAVAPIALIAALPLAMLARAVWRVVWDRLAAWQERMPEPAGTSVAFAPRMLARQAAALALACAVTAVPLGVALARNVDGYFVLHAQDVPSWLEMGGRATIMGRAAAALAAEGYTVRVSPSMAGDPALTFAAGEQSFPAFDPDIPVPLPVPAGGLALLMSVDDSDVFGFVRRSYPQAQILTLAPSFDHTNTQAYAVLIRQADAERNLGVRVTFGTGAAARTIEHAQGAIPWPSGSDAATPASLSGTLLIAANAAWQPLALRVTGARQATLTLDGTPWPSGVTSAIRLGAGNHDLRVTAQGSAAATLGLEWSLDAGQSWEPIPSLALAAPTLPTGGLLGLYYARPTIGGAVAMARVDQFVNTYYQNPPVGINFPFAARWQGALHIAASGDYGFRLDSTGPATLFIDGQQVVSDEGGPANAEIPLSAGVHQIRLDYIGAGSYLHCYFTWLPPGQTAFTPVPPSATEPAHG